MAIEATDFTFAELASAALDEIDTVHFMIHICGIPYPEVRGAELLLFKRNRADAERKLLAAGIRQQRIKMNIRLYQTQSARDIAETAGGPVAAAATTKV
jgi:hypothetical protein